MQDTLATETPRQTEAGGSCFIDSNMLYWNIMEGLKAETIDIAWIDPEQVSGWFAASMAQQTRDMQYFGCAGNIFRRTASQPIVARNLIFQDFLEHSDSPWLWMVDADMIFDDGHPMKLWEIATEYGASMVSGLAFIWKDGRIAIPSVFYENEDQELIQYHNRLKEEPHQIAAAGLASTLIHRDVIASMEPYRHPDYRWFDFIPNRDIGINADEMTGIDVQFFVRARQLGFKHYLAPHAQTHHLEDMSIGLDEWRRQWKSVS